MRNDADALWAHHGVRLAGVIEVQLLENASRFGSKTFLHGLDKCVKRELGLTFDEECRWAETKRAVKAQMDNDVFARRPLDAKTLEYCANDVVHLPALHAVYARRITDWWMTEAMAQSARRVVKACSPEYEPQSKAKAFGPWGYRFVDDDDGYDPDWP